jgi:hypothetical protein
MKFVFFPNLSVITKLVIQVTQKNVEILVHLAKFTFDRIKDLLYASVILCWKKNKIFSAAI